MIKAGDRVRSIGRWKGVTGTVEAVYDWAESGPLSIENHGCIEVRIAKIDTGTYKWASVGGLEHFVMYNWQEHLEVIE